MKPFARLQRQFRLLSDQLNQLIAEQKWDRLSKNQQQELQSKLRRLYHRLQSRVSSKKLSQALGAAAILLTGWTHAGAQTPAFSPAVQNPFSLTAIPTYLSRTSFADLDNDGDLDMLGVDAYATFYYYQNTGSATNPNFAQALTNPFGLNPPFQYAYVLSVSLGDLDGDGDFDLIVGDYYGNIAYIPNQGTVTVPNFTAALPTPFGMGNFPAMNSTPRFTDIDNDGDLDVLSGSYYGEFYYYQNTGVATAPAFGNPVTGPFGLLPGSQTYTIPDLADLDGDGDDDLLLGVSAGNFFYFQNNGTPAAPSFGTPTANPFGLTNNGSYSSPTFVDLDSDGDFDLMAGEEYGNFFYFENNSAPCVPTAGSLTTTACDAFTAPSGAVFTNSGTFADTIPNLNGCDSLISINLTILQSSSETINATGCQTYTSPAGNVYTTSGTFNEIIPNSVGCDSNLTIQLQLTSLDLNVSNSGGVLISAATNVSYQWIECGVGPVAGATGATFAPTTTGDYAVIITDGTCSDTSACETVTQVGIDESALTGINLSPNPGRDQFVLDLGHRMEAVEVSVHDINGREVFRRAYWSEEEIMVQSKVAPGLYTVTVRAEGKIAHLKWIVE